MGNTERAKEYDFLPLMPQKQQRVKYKLWEASGELNRAYWCSGLLNILRSLVLTKGDVAISLQSPFGILKWKAAMKQHLSRFRCQGSLAELSQCLAKAHAFKVMAWTRTELGTFKWISIYFSTSHGDWFHASLLIASRRVLSSTRSDPNFFWIPIFCAPSTRPGQHFFSTSHGAMQTLPKALLLPNS